MITTFQVERFSLTSSRPAGMVLERAFSRCAADSCGVTRQRPLSNAPFALLQNQRDIREIAMDAHLAFGSNSKIRDSLAIFTLDAERWLAALYGCVQKAYGNQAARVASDCWLGILENCLDETCELAELERITKAAIILFAFRAE